MVFARVNLNDKSEAVNKLIELCGDEFVEKEPKDAYVKKILEITEKHEKKYTHRKMSLKELGAVCTGE